LSDKAVDSLQGVGMAKKGTPDIKIETDMKNVIQGTGKLTASQIDEYLKIATKNPSSKKVILGSSGTYDVIGGTKGYTYFNMTDKEWNALVAKATNNYDEVWKVNKKFLEKQIADKKEILLSNNPNIGYYFPDGKPRFYQREIDYLKSKKYEFIDNGDGLWKAVKAN
jgi:hypothetical protein